LDPLDRKSSKGRFRDDGIAVGPSLKRESSREVAQPAPFGLRIRKSNADHRPILLRRTLRLQVGGSASRWSISEMLPPSLRKGGGSEKPSRLAHCAQLLKDQIGLVSGLARDGGHAPRLPNNSVQSRLGLHCYFAVDL
jgi:hypothetical protein